MLRTLGCEQQEPSSRFSELEREIALIGRARECDRLDVVMRQQLRVIGDALAGRPLEPHRCGSVALRLRAARDLGVRDVANEQMPERVLEVALERRPPGGANELFPRELVQPFAHNRLVEAAHLGERAGPEDLADHGGVVEQRLALGRSVSSRASISACTVAGTGISPSASTSSPDPRLVRMPRSVSIRTNSSA